jgi:hypothetical protein
MAHAKNQKMGTMYAVIFACGREFEVFAPSVQVAKKRVSEVYIGKVVRVDVMSTAGQWVPT